MCFHFHHGNWHWHRGWWVSLASVRHYCRYRGGMPNAQPIVHLDLLHQVDRFCCRWTLRPIFVRQQVDCLSVWHDVTNWCVHDGELQLVVALSGYSMIVVWLNRPVTFDNVRLTNQDHEWAFDHQLRKMHPLHDDEFDNEILHPIGAIMIYAWKNRTIWKMSLSIRIWVRTTFFRIENWKRIDCALTLCKTERT